MTFHIGRAKIGWEEPENRKPTHWDWESLPGQVYYKTGLLQYNTISAKLCESQNIFWTFQAYKSMHVHGAL